MNKDSDRSRPVAIRQRGLPAGTLKASNRKRVLFIAEAVTLAHVARPVVLAQALDPKAYEVHLACDPRYHRLLPERFFSLHPIDSIPSAEFLAALARGSPLYGLSTLRAYVKQDIEMIEAVQPDLVVGDFRLSLAVSAPLTDTPYLAITNAYWSPYARQHFPLPELPIGRFLGLRVAKRLFKIMRPIAFAYHCIPLNRLRREHGLPPLGYDLRRIHTAANHTVYATRACTVIRSSIT